MKYASFLTIASASILLTGCLSSTQLSKTNGPSPLAVASCPLLTPLQDNTFGATASKLVEVAGIYYECRAAALAQQEKPE